MSESFPFQSVAQSTLSATLRHLPPHYARRQVAIQTAWRHVVNHASLSLCSLRGLSTFSSPTHSCSRADGYLCWNLCGFSDKCRHLSEMWMLRWKRYRESSSWSRCADISSLGGFLELDDAEKLLLELVCMSFQPSFHRVLDSDWYPAGSWPPKPTLHATPLSLCTFKALIKSAPTITRIS